MKALEILKNGISFMTMHKDLNPQSREYLESEISQYEEAIKELESMLEPETLTAKIQAGMDNVVDLYEFPIYIRDFDRINGTIKAIKDWEEQLKQIYGKGE